MQLQEQWWAQMLDSFEIRAEQPGFVIYGNHPWTRAKFQDGDTVQTSFKVAQVANTEALAVRVWINGVDRPGIETGDRVRVMLDALAGQQFCWPHRATVGERRTPARMGQSRLF